MNIDSHQLPPIGDDKQFESMIRDILKVRLQNRDGVQLNGTKGQRQHSIDVFGRDSISMEWVGAQCKVREIGKKLTVKEITKEVAGLEGFNPKISTYIIATTSKRDTNLQQAAALLSTNQLQVIVWSWEDISEILNGNDYLKIKIKYFSPFFVDAHLLGNTIGKVITLEIGTDGRYSSRYHLFIGKTTNHDPHFKDTYFISDLFSKTIDNFSIPAFESDIEAAIKSRHDRKIILHWINDLNNIDNEVIYSDVREFYFTISSKTLLEDYALDEE